MFLPWLYIELGSALTLLISPNAFDPHNPELLGLATNERAVMYIQPIAAIVSGVTASFAALGEEAGWRSDSVLSFLISMIPMMVIASILHFAPDKPTV